MNCALIGLGMVAPTHVAALQASDAVSLAGVLGRDPDRAASFAKHHSVPKVYTSLQELCADKTLDFVILATPPDARNSILQPLIDAHLPVLMEKPIERTMNASTRIVNAFDAANLLLGIVLQHRARAASQALRDAISKDALGQITNAEIRVPWWRDQSYYDAPGRGTYARDGGGVLLTQAIHTLDLALWLMGPVAEVQAMLATTPLHDLEAEDWAGGLLRFDSGALATLNATTAAFPGGAESIFIQGTKAAATLAEGVVQINYLDGHSEILGATAGTGGGADPMAFTHDWHQTMIEDFAIAVETGRAPLASGRDALQAHVLIDALERASKTGTTTKVTKI